MEKRVLLIQSSEQDSKKRRLEESGAATIHNIFNPSSLCLSNLMLEIVHRFETFDILQLAQVCRKFKILFYHQRIWKHLCPPEIILLNSSRNYRIVFKEFMSTSKLLLMPLLSFRKGGQEQRFDQCDHFTELELELKVKNLSRQHINYIKSCKKIMCPDEYSGLSYEWKLCLTQIRKSGNREFSCVFSTFKTRDDQFYFQTFPFNPLTSLRNLKPGSYFPSFLALRELNLSDLDLTLFTSRFSFKSRFLRHIRDVNKSYLNSIPSFQLDVSYLLLLGETSRQSFAVPMQWLLHEAKEISTQSPLFYYFRKKKIHKFRIYFIYTCKNPTSLNITDGTFQTNSIYISLNRGD